MSAPQAVVVGLCGHGLAITRALADSGVKVIAVEANKLLPGYATSKASKVLVADINGIGLIDSLVQLARTLDPMPALFLTNDRMIETVGQNHERISDLYRVSWLHSRNDILPLLRKENVYRRCVETGLSHPKSAIIRSSDDIGSQLSNLKFPIIIKPDRPISRYKTLILEHEDRVQAHFSTIATALPAVAQEFIPGDDTRIYFAALYLDHGRVLARYEGRKLRSRPMGHTTIAVGDSNDLTHGLARRFFSGLNLSGPVSLELKMDPTGAFWVIEPTVGRTDFWVGLCTADGVNLPFVEYNHVAGYPATVSTQKASTLWINEERDPAAPLWLLKNHPSLLWTRQWAWLYGFRGDYKPCLKWIAMRSSRLPFRVRAKIRKTFFVRKAG